MTAGSRHAGEFSGLQELAKSWTVLCGEAAAFASEKGKERLINISVSEDQNEGVIVVWYVGLRRT